MTQTFNKTKLPLFVTIICIVVTIIPFLFNLIGVDFGSNRIPLEETKDILNKGGNVNNLFNALEGAFTHTLLEWSAFCCALFVAIMAISNFNITNDVTTPIIGLALFSSGCMDAFHTLSADRLIHGVADATNLVPFTWAISRVFNAIIMIIGVSLLLIREKDVKKVKSDPRKSRGILIILGVGVFFGLTAYSVIYLSSTSEVLPQTMFPDSFISRPWDVVPLVLFVLAGIFIYPKFYKRHKSIFAYAIMLSVIPEVVTEAHMAFGSEALFDNHFNIAHFLKIFAYLIPFIGLVFDYSYTYKVEQQSIKLLEVSKIELENERLNLLRSNTELESFAYVASHDLQEPLRVVASYMQLLENKYGDQLDERASKYIHNSIDAAIRMKNLIIDLLEFSNIDTSGENLEKIDTNELLDSILEDLSISINENSAKINIEELPNIEGDIGQIRQLFQNLISNAIKFKHKERNSIIDISAKVNGAMTTFYVTDNGIGMKTEYFDRIFTIFQRLHHRQQYPGTGIGLSICKKIIELHGGEISVESEEDKGSTFIFTLPNAS